MTTPCHFPRKFPTLQSTSEKDTSLFKSPLFSAQCVPSTHFTHSIKIQEEKSSPSVITQPPAYEVTFLNKVCQVQLKTATQQISMAQQVAKLVCLYFDVKMDVIKESSLIDVLEEDKVGGSLSPSRPYFLAFTRHSDKSLVKKSEYQTGEEGVYVRKIQKKKMMLFHRNGRDFVKKTRKEFEEGWVTELKLTHRERNRTGFTCPFTHCGRNFQKSCDLTIHFLVETGKHPFQCTKCGEFFRRRVLLSHHICEARRFISHPSKFSLPLSNLAGTYSCQRKAAPPSLLKKRSKSQDLKPVEKIYREYQNSNEAAAKVLKALPSNELNSLATLQMKKNSKVLSSLHQAKEESEDLLRALFATGLLLSVL